MSKNLLCITMMLVTSWSWAQLTIAPADKQKTVNYRHDATIHVNNSAGATYIASVSGGVVIEDGGQEKSVVITNAPSITINAASGDGKLYIIDAATSRPLDSAMVTVNALLLGPITGPECISQAGTATYSVSPVLGMTYLWVVERGGIQIISGQGSPTVTVQSVNKANAMLTVYIYPRFIPQLCAAQQRSITIRKTFSNTANGLVGPDCLDPQTLAANDSIIAFFIEPVLGDFAGANSNDYLWTIPPSLQPRYTSPDGSARTFKVLNTAADLTVSVTVGARCNPNNIVTKHVRVPPAPPVMSQTDYCFANTQTATTFTVDPAYDRPGYNYRWTLPLNWQFAGTDSTSASVNVIMDASAGNVTVAADNAGCGGAQSTFTVNRVISGAAITSTNGACVAYGDVTEKIYTVSPPNNNLYNWSIPPGWTIKPGTPANTSSIIMIPSGTNGGAISATTQGCGGVSSTIPPLHAQIGPVAPVYVNGPLCISGSTPSTALTYTVNNLGSGVTYHWKFPSGWVLSSNGAPVSNFVATTTNSISVRFSSARTTGIVSVYAKGCVESDTTTWEVFDTPAMPLLASGTNCPSQGAGTVTYEVNPVYNSDFVWSVNASNGWSAAILGETSRTAIFNAGNGPSTITVRAVGIQGCAGIQSAPLSFPVNVKPNTPVIVRTDADCITVGAPDNITLSVDNQTGMPAGVTYAWTMPVATPAWTASSPSAATTDVTTNGVPRQSPGYIVSVAVSNTLCGSTTGTLEIPIGLGLTGDIEQVQISPPDPTGGEPGVFYYAVPNTAGATYVWSLFDRNTGTFLSSPIRRSSTRPYEVFLNLEEGFAAPLRATDSLVVIITESSGCQTTKFNVAESFTASPSHLLSSSSARSSSTENNDVLFDVNEIEQESGSNEFAVYPNPAKGRVTVTWPKGREAKLMKVTIVDIHGRSKKVVEVKGKKKTEIDISQLPASTYVVLIQSDRGIAYEKLIIQ
jgi:hypothetical protein